MSKTKTTVAVTQAEPTGPRSESELHAAAPQSSPENSPAWRELPKIQQEFAELAADLIQNGGDSDDVELFIIAVKRHDWRRAFPDQPYDKVEEHAIKKAADDFRELARNWPEKKRQPEAPKPVTVAEMIRSNYRKRLESEFADFLSMHAKIDDVYLLLEILELYNNGDAELGEAFAITLGGSRTYVPVDEKHEKRVRDFIQILDDCGRASCAAAR